MYIAPQSIHQDIQQEKAEQFSYLTPHGIAELLFFYNSDFFLVAYFSVFLNYLCCLFYFLLFYSM